MSEKKITAVSLNSNPDIDSGWLYMQYNEVAVNKLTGAANKPILDYWFLGDTDHFAKLNVEDFRRGEDGKIDIGIIITSSRKEDSESHIRMIGRFVHHIDGHVFFEPIMDDNGIDEFVKRYNAAALFPNGDKDGDTTWLTFNGDINFNRPKNAVDFSLVPRTGLGVLYAAE